ncbi:MAG: phenylacetate--CoA ligase [Actinobacteria bacterium]|nr:phenylacetate--CoA ligase [Actinomycetota bacterium]
MDATAMQPEELATLRDARARETVRRCFEGSAFYRGKLLDAGAEPGDVTSVADLDRLPILLAKDDERELQERSRVELGHPFGEHLTAPLESVVGVASTSGTTGTPTFYAFTEADVQTTNELWGRAFRFAGIRPGDTVLHGFGLSMFLAGVPVVRALERMGARPVPIGAEAGSERLLRMADLTRPRVLACTPSYAQYLAEQAPKVLGRPADELGIEVIFCAGEPGAGLPEVRSFLQRSFGAKLYDMLGGAHGVMCCSCDAEPYQGMHVLGEDCAITTQLVDQETKEPIALTEGATGERVKTSLRWEAQPQLRASVGDVYMVHTDPCPCGLPGVRIRVLGRTDDLLIVKGVKIYPAAVKNVVHELMPLASGHFRIVLSSPPPRVEPPLRLTVERGEGVDEAGAEQLAGELERRLHHRLTVRPEITVVPMGTLERTALKEKLIEKAYEGG